MSAEAERFGRVVARRRRLLCLTLDQVREAGGPSDVTTGKIERGQLPNPSARTLQRLDVGLAWTQGSAARAWSGGEPTAIEDAPTHRAPSPTAVDAADDSVTLALSAVIDLSGIAKDYERATRRLGAHPAYAQMIQINRRLDLLVDRILRAWLIGQLESRAAPGAPLLGDPMVEMLLGDYLNRAPEPPTEEDAVELLYLRWLTGRVSELDAATEHEFVSRWEGRQEAAR